MYTSLSFQNVSSSKKGMLENFILFIYLFVCLFVCLFIYFYHFLLAKKLSKLKIKRKCYYLSSTRPGNVMGKVFFFSLSLSPMFDNNNSDLNNVWKLTQLKLERKVSLARQCWMTSGYTVPSLSARHRAMLPHPQPRPPSGPSPSIWDLPVPADQSQLCIRGQSCTLSPGKCTGP